jgi:hypothetical protein
LYREVKRSAIVKRFIIGGSFITSKPEPNDFDCILVLEPTVRSDNLRPMDYNLASRRMAHHLFRGDIIPVTEDSIEYHNYMNLFQTTRYQKRVGIVEIEL